MFEGRAIRGAPFSFTGSLDKIMMLTGFIYGVAACALWGLVYMIPLWLAAYDPLLIALARYTIFGALSTALLFFNLRYVRQMTAGDWWSAIALGVIGNLFFYWLLASAVQPVLRLPEPSRPLFPSAWQSLQIYPQPASDMELPGGSLSFRFQWLEQEWYASTGPSLHTFFRHRQSRLQASGWASFMPFSACLSGPGIH